MAIKDDDSLSRRDLLVAGAGVGASAATTAIAQTQPITYEEVKQAGVLVGVVLGLSGQPKVAVRTAAFAGQPLLRIGAGHDPARRRFEFVLSGATFPGTSTGADQVVSVRNGLLTAKFSGLGLTFEGNAAEFLAGLTRIKVSVKKAISLGLAVSGGSVKADNVLSFASLGIRDGALAILFEREIALEPRTGWSFKAAEVEMTVGNFDGIAQTVFDFTAQGADTRAWLDPGVSKATQTLIPTARLFERGRLVVNPAEQLLTIDRTTQSRDLLELRLDLLKRADGSRVAILLEQPSYRSSLKSGTKEGVRFGASLAPGFNDWFVRDDVSYEIKARSDTLKQPTLPDLEVSLLEGTGTYSCRLGLKRSWAEIADAISLPAPLPAGSVMLITSGPNGLVAQQKHEISVTHANDDPTWVGPTRWRAGVARADDLLVLTWDFEGYRLAGDQLTKPLELDATVRVLFPPQHMAEGAFFKNEALIRPVDHRFSGESQLAFSSRLKRLSFRLNSTSKTTPALLDWQELVPLEGTEGTELRERTFLELPYRMWLTPTAPRWTYARKPSSRKGMPKPPGPTLERELQRVELWHADLAASNGVRPIDYRATDDGAPSHPTLAASDRRDIILLTNQLNTTVRAKKLSLTALGATANLHGEWIDPSGKIALTSWKQNVSLGRDTFVEVKYRGFLYPTGHPATLIKVSERKIEAVDGDLTSLLRQRFYIVVTTPTIWLSHVPSKHQRAFPFKQLRVVTVTTPDLEEITEGPDFQWVRLEPTPSTPAADLLFQMIGTDHGDHEVTFSAPLAFVVRDARLPARFQAVVASLAAEPQASSHRTVPLASQQLQVAQKGGTNAIGVATEIEWAGLLPAGKVLLPADEIAAFVPQMNQARLLLPAAIALGQSTAATFSYTKEFLEHEFEDINKEVRSVLEAKTSSVLAFANAAKSGALFRPDIAIGGLTEAGIVGLKNTQGFDPTAYFDAGAKLLGGVSLRDIFDPKKILQHANQGRGLAPKISYAVDGPALAPKSVGVTFEWEVANEVGKPSPFSDKPLKFGNAGRLKVSVAQTTVLNPVKSSFTYRGELHDFTLDVFGVLQIGFKKFVFAGNEQSASRPEIELGEITFAGELAFLKAFQSLFGSLKVPYLDLSPSGVGATYRFTLPDLGGATFSMTNLSLKAGFKVPFDGVSPVSVNFGVGDARNRFTISFVPFGGGGYFALELTPDGLRSLEAALEFGGILSLDVLVASGRVYVFVGIFFGTRSDAGKQVTAFSAFVRAGGCLNVLGLISVSIEVYLSLTYKDRKLSGFAMVTVRIEILFFSTEASFSIERTFTEPEEKHAALPSSTQIDSAYAFSEELLEQYYASFA